MVNLNIALQSSSSLNVKFWKRLVYPLRKNYAKITEKKSEIAKNLLCNEK